MYPENRNPNKGRNIVIGILVALVFTGLFAGGAAVVMRYVRLAESGKLQEWLEANAQEETDITPDYNEYSGNSGNPYFAEGTDPEELFNRPTYDEDIEGYATGEYFSFPADNRVEGLNYSVQMEENVYEDGASTYISYSYPVVSKDAPNADYINDIICAEWESLIEYYEDDYKRNLPYYYGEDYEDFADSDGIIAELAGSVTYMSEDILSIVYRESIYYGEYMDYEADLCLYCLNFDMKNGVLLENTGMFDIDKAFVEDFRKRSRKQNASSVLDDYEDEEIWNYFDSDYCLILFYCPQGMEIGLNLENGWVTVTYADYEKYLKRV